LTINYRFDSSIFQLNYIKKNSLSFIDSYLPILFSFHLYYIAIAIEQIISMCCSEGEEWGTQRNSCSDYKQRLDLVPNELYGLCLSTVEICCSKQQEIYQCTAGQIAAKSGLDCYQKDKKSHTGIEYYKVGNFFTFSLCSNDNIVLITLL
jgi:hypothetical protein